MNFGHGDVLAAAAHIVNFQDMEAHAGTYRADYIAFFRGAQRLGEDARQFLNPAPAHLAAFQRLLVGRVGDSQFAKVRAAARLLNH